MKLGISNERLKYGFVVVTVLISINLWSFQLIPEGVYNMLEVLVLVGILLVVSYHHLVLRRKLLFKTNVYLFMLVPVISAFGAYAFHDQPIPLTLLILRLHLLWLFYFVLHIFDFPKERIIKLMVVVGAVWVALTVLQQFTYPTYYFYSKAESDSYSIRRGGVYRFMVYGHQYGAFFVIYFFYQYLVKNKSSHLLYVLLGLIGYYYYGTRQFALALAACMLIIALLVKGRAQLTAIVCLLIGVPVLLAFKDVLFAQYIEMTNEQFKYGDNIRQLSADFWLNKYWPDQWFAKITGNGPPHKLSGYGREMELIRVYTGFYRSDVGIIGAFNEYGILYALNILWVNFKGLRSRYFSGSDKYLRLLYINAIILLVTSQYYSSAIGVPFYCMVFYLTEKSFEEKKAEAETEEESEKELELAV